VFTVFLLIPPPPSLSFSHFLTRSPSLSLIQDPSNQFQFDEIEDDEDDEDDDDGENDEDRQVSSNFNQRVAASDNSAAFDANFANFDAAFEANFADFSNSAATAASSSSTAGDQTALDQTAFDAVFDDDSVDVLDILASADDSSSK